jgi:hypothetical protein
LKLDLIIKAQCSDPTFTARHDRYAGINAWYGHAGGMGTKPVQQSTVATFQVAPGDWSFSPPCRMVKNLKYQFKVANVFQGGTYDKIYFALGKGKKITLGSSVSAGFTKEDVINLKDVFGKDTVDIGDLKKVTLGDDLGSSIFSGDGWTFQGKRSLLVTNFLTTGLPVPSHTLRPHVLGNLCRFAKEGANEEI